MVPSSRGRRRFSLRVSPVEVRSAMTSAKLAAGAASTAPLMRTGVK